MVTNFYKQGQWGVGVGVAYHIDDEKKAVMFQLRWS